MQVPEALGVLRDCSTALSVLLWANQNRLLDSVYADDELAELARDYVGRSFLKEAKQTVQGI